MPDGEEGGAVPRYAVYPMRGILTLGSYQQGKSYNLQTNVFSASNGGREQRISLWFDPTLKTSTPSLCYRRRVWCPSGGCCPYLLE